jgi:hypothetical protein
MESNNVIRRVILFILIFFLPINGIALIGDLIPGVCLIACGRGGGIVNFQFPGEVFKSVVTGPSIEELDKRLTNQRQSLVQEAGDRLGKILEEKGKGFVNDFDNKLTGQRTALISDFERLLSEATVEIDSTLKNNIDNVMERLDSEIGKGSGTLLDIFASFSSLLVYAAAVIISMIIFAYAASKTATKNSSWHNLSQRIWKPLAVTAAVCTMATGFSVWAKSYVMDKPRLGFCNAYSNGDVNQIVYYASEINRLADDSQESNSELTVAKIIRDALLRPTIVSDNLKDFLIEPALNHQKGLVNKGKNRNPDLDALLALVLWQKGDDRLSEYVAAVFAASSLRESSGGINCGKTTKPLLWESAKSILEAYLMFPITDKEWPFILGSYSMFSGFTRASTNEVSSQLNKIFSPLFLQPLNTLQLREIAGAVSPFAQEEDVERSTKIQETKRILREVHLRGSELYARTLLLHASAVAESDPIRRKKILQFRDEAVREATRYWEDTFEKLSHKPNLSEFIAASRAFHVGYGRVKELLIPAEIDAIPTKDEDKHICSVDRKWVPKRKGTDIFHDQLELAFKAGMSHFAGHALILEASIRFEQQSRALYALEYILLKGVVPVGRRDFSCGTEPNILELVRNLPNPQLDREPFYDTESGRVITSWEVSEFIVDDAYQRMYLEEAVRAAGILGLYVCQNFEDPESCRNQENWIPLSNAIQKIFIKEHDVLDPNTWSEFQFPLNAKSATKYSGLGVYGKATGEAMKKRISLAF